MTGNEVPYLGCRWDATVVHGFDSVTCKCTRERERERQRQCTTTAHPKQTALQWIKYKEKHARPRALDIDNKCVLQWGHTHGGHRGLPSSNRVREAVLHWRVDLNKNNTCTTQHPTHTCQHTCEIYTLTQQVARCVALAIAFALPF